MKKNPTRLLAVVPLLLAFLALGCAKEQAKYFVSEFFKTFGEPVECPKSDSTPPAAELVFSHPVTGKTIRLKTGDPNMTIPIKPTDRFFVMAVGEDPEGVKKIQIYSPSAPQCESVGEIGCKVFPGLTVPNTLQVGGALSRLWLPQQIEVTGAQCPAECRLVSWSKSVFATVTNCAGLKTTTPSVVFTVQYP